MKVLKPISIALIALVTLVSCNNETEQNEQAINRKQIEVSLIEANKKAVMVEDRQIEDYISAHQWKMQKTGTGLRYIVDAKGSGSIAKEGNVGVIEYSVELITGNLLYSSDSLGFMEFKIGRGGVEAGLEEGILLLREGDSAKFILPSHLAYGLTGDGDKIPPKSTLIYNVKLLKIKDKN